MDFQTHSTCWTWNGGLICKTEMGIWVPGAPLHHHADPRSACHSSLWKILGLETNVKKMKDNHSTERYNEDDKNHNSSLVPRPSCVPGAMLSTDFPHQTCQSVMSEAECSVSCPKTLEKNIGLLAYRQQARLSWKMSFSLQLSLASITLFEWISLKWDQEKKRSRMVTVHHFCTHTRVCVHAPGRLCSGALSYTWV